MRIEFQTEGGIAHFPGLSRPVAIDSDALAEEEARELARLVEAARFFERPTVAGAPRGGAADYRQYTSAGEEGERRGAVMTPVPVSSADSPRADISPAFPR